MNAYKNRCSFVFFIFIALNFLIRSAFYSEHDNLTAGPKNFTEMRKQTLIK